MSGHSRVGGAAARRVPKVRAVVLNFNGGEHVLRCVEHLTRTEWPADRFELVVVDNASGDGSDAAVQERFEQVRLIQTGANLGFPANNVAMRDLTRDGVDYVALVNNDAFVEPGWLAPLVESLEAQPDLGAACPRILFEPRFVEVVIDSPTFVPPGDGRDLGVRVHDIGVDGRSQFGLTQFIRGAWGQETGPDGPFRWTSSQAVLRVPAGGVGAGFGFTQLFLAAEATKEVTLTCGRYRVHVEVGPEPVEVQVPHWEEPFDVVNNAGSILVDDGSGADRGYLEPDGPDFDEPAEVFNWCGGGVLLRRAYLEHVGLFDERFFLYYEDTDLSWRGRRRGWRYVYEPTAVVRHHHASSSGVGSPTFRYYTERNRLLMLAKNAPARLAWRAGLGETRRAVAVVLRHYVKRPLTLRLPVRAEVAHRWRVYRGYLRLLPAMLADR
nr:glycosyltransferase family 2 protein [Acidimicrobiales bacterium]